MAHDNSGGFEIPDRVIWNGEASSFREWKRAYEWWLEGLDTDSQFDKTGRVRFSLAARLARHRGPVQLKLRSYGPGCFRRVAGQWTHRNRGYAVGRDNNDAMEVVAADAAIGLFELSSRSVSAVKSPRFRPEINHPSCNGLIHSAISYDKKYA